MEQVNQDLEELMKFKSLLEEIKHKHEYLYKKIFENNQNNDNNISFYNNEKKRGVFVLLQKLFDYNKPIEIMYKDNKIKFRIIDSFNKDNKNIYHVEINKTFLFFKKIVENM